MDYIELNIPISDAETAEILTAELSELPFESFVEDKDMLKAYIPQHKLIDCKDDADAILLQYGISGHSYVQIETQNWNALWESNFEPVSVDGRVLIRAPFHKHEPGYEMDIVIMPKMSFGTGHHATTHMMVEMLLATELKHKVGLDMGCGTGVLAIVAAKCGAKSMDAVDIDDFAYENCTDNVNANDVSELIHPILGDVKAIDGNRYDFILANINRNILIRDMDKYLFALNAGGEIFMSGFLDTDIEIMRDTAHEKGLKDGRTLNRNGWAALSFIK